MEYPCDETLLDDWAYNKEIWVQLQRKIKSQHFCLYLEFSWVNLGYTKTTASLKILFGLNIGSTHLKYIICGAHLGNAIKWFSSPLCSSIGSSVNSGYLKIYIICYILHIQKKRWRSRSQGALVRTKQFLFSFILQDRNAKRSSAAFSKGRVAADCWRSIVTLLSMSNISFALNPSYFTEITG